MCTFPWPWFYMVLKGNQCDSISLTVPDICFTGVKREDDVSDSIHVEFCAIFLSFKETACTVYKIDLVESDFLLAIR